MNISLEIQVKCNECFSWIATTLGVVIQSQVTKSPMICSRCCDYALKYGLASLKDSIKSWKDLDTGKDRSHFP